MHPTKPRLRHVIGMASLTGTLAFATLSLSSLPAGAQTAPVAATSTTCPVLSLANPNPADNLQPGGLFVSGTAYDPSATSGSGVSRVDLFLGARESGGLFLGSAVPGNAPGGNPRAFSVEVTVPALNRGEDFAAYATSAVSGQETTVTFPVLVGVQPAAKNPVATPTPIPLTENVTTTCPAGAAAAVPATAPGSSSSAVPTPAAAPSGPAMAVPAVAAGATASCPVLSVANPNPADDLQPGAFFISGTAFDPAATSGSGISRVDLFLGERDNGGTFLGSAVPGEAGGNSRAFSVEVTVPSVSRATDFAAYAISAVSGHETTVTFPVLVGPPPAKNPVATPTPIPLTENVSTNCG